MLQTESALCRLLFYLKLRKDKVYEENFGKNIPFNQKKYFIEKPKSEILTIYENNGIIEIEKTNYLLFKII